jgi:hypothetical protein
MLMVVAKLLTRRSKPSKASRLALPPTCDVFVVAEA